MDRVTFSEVEANLGDLVDRASRGEEIEIVRQGRTVARLSPPKRPIAPADVQPFDWAAVKAMTDRMTPQTESAGDFFRRMRDGDRY